MASTRANKHLKRLFVEDMGMEDVCCRRMCILYHSKIPNAHLLPSSGAFLKKMCEIFFCTLCLWFVIVVFPDHTHLLF